METVQTIGESSVELFQAFAAAYRLVSRVSVPNRLESRVSVPEFDVTREHFPNSKERVQLKIKIDT